MDQPVNKRKRNFYGESNKKRSFTLEPGLKGFLCSCNFREKDCIRETYNLLNAYCDLDKSDSKPDLPISDETEIEEQLSNEIRCIQSENKNQKRFQVVESGAKNFLFIRTTISEPVNLAATILKDIYESKEQKTRFLLRLIPIEITCKANINDILKSFEPLLDKYFADSSKSFSVVFNHRNNNQLSKDAVIKAIAEAVSAKRSDHTVNLKEAELAIIVEVIRGIALLGVVPNFFKYKKYNLHMFADNTTTDVAPENNEENKGNDESMVICTICKGEFSIVIGERSAITKHIDTNKHKTSLDAAASTSKLNTFFKTDSFGPNED